MADLAPSGTSSCAEADAAYCGRGCVVDALDLAGTVSLVADLQVGIHVADHGVLSRDLSRED